VDDLAIGIRFVNPTPASYRVRIRWRVRRILIDPPPIAKVYLNQGQPDYTVTWWQAAGSKPVCNGIRIPPINGYQAEFWRLSKKNGGAIPHSGISGVPRRQGRRYVPFFRGSVDQWILHMDEFRGNMSGTSYRWYYRVCYVNPITGARSGLSNDIVVVNQLRDEMADKSLRRSRWSVWIA